MNDELIKELITANIKLTESINKLINIVIDDKIATRVKELQFEQYELMNCRQIADVARQLARRDP